MNNETIIEFGFRMISKIMQISEHNSAHPTQPHSIITNSFHNRGVHFFPSYQIPRM